MHNSIHHSVKSIPLLHRSFDGNDDLVSDLVQRVTAGGFIN